VSGGFSNWKHSLEKGKGIVGHATSIPHTISSQIFIEYKMRTTMHQSVVEVYDSARVEVVRRNRAKICKIASMLHFCARQGIALRGHDEDDRYKILFSLLYCSACLLVDHQIGGILWSFSSGQQAPIRLSKFS
jgi:hypothetical protein